MEYRIGALLSGSGAGKGTVLGHIGKSVGLVKESFDDTPPHPADIDGMNDSHISVFAVLLFTAEVVFYLLIGAYASYLSWTANSSIGWHPGFRVLFSFISFFFAATYIIGHLLFKLDILAALQAARMLQGRANTTNARPRQAIPAIPAIPATPAIPVP